MPHMTQAHPFEWKVLCFAQTLAATLAGAGTCSFLMVLTDQGAVRTLQFEPPQGGWFQITASMDQAGGAYLFYDPFDAPEYTWLSWRRIGRATMERLIGRHFEEADFVKSQPASSWAPDLEPPNTYPASWGVMF